MDDLAALKLNKEYVFGIEHNSIETIKIIQFAVVHSFDHWKLFYWLTIFLFKIVFSILSEFKNKRMNVILLTILMITFIFLFHKIKRELWIIFYIFFLLNSI